MVTLVHSERPCGIEVLLTLVESAIKDSIRSTAFDRDLLERSIVLKIFGLREYSLFGQWFIVYKNLSASNEYRFTGQPYDATNIIVSITGVLEHYNLAAR